MNYIKSIYKTQLFKISSLNGVSVLVRIAGGLVASKIIAKYLGPGGMAIVGNLRNFLTSLEAISTLGLQNGIIKYTAENEKNEEKIYSILATIFISLFTVILFISLLLLVFSEYWSQRVFGLYGEYAWVFKVLAFSLPWYAGSLIFMAVLTGLGNYKRVILLNILGNILGTGMSAILIWKYNTNGALLGLILFQSVFFFFSFYILYRRFPGLPFLKWKYFDHTLLYNFFSYSLMTLVTAFLSPFVYIGIRDNLTENLGENMAGFWEAVNRISVFYLMFATTMLTVYFFPKLSAAQTPKETKTVFGNYYKSIVPLFAVGLAIIYFLRDFIVRFLFTDDFLPMENLFFWQLLGDFFKVCSLILGYELIAKKRTKAFVIIEISSIATLYFSSMFLIENYGVKGAVMAHSLTHFLLLVILFLYSRKKVI